MAIPQVLQSVGAGLKPYDASGKYSHKEAAKAAVPVTLFIASLGVVTATVLMLTPGALAMPGLTFASGAAATAALAITPIGVGVLGLGVGTAGAVGSVALANHLGKKKLVSSQQIL